MCFINLLRKKLQQHFWDTTLWFVDQGVPSNFQGIFGFVFFIHKS